jgi:hypothetical protein
LIGEHFGGERCIAMKSRRDCGHAQRSHDGTARGRRLFLQGVSELSEGRISPRFGGGIDIQIILAAFGQAPSALTPPSVHRRFYRSRGNRIA